MIPNLFFKKSQIAFADIVGVADKEREGWRFRGNLRDEHRLGGFVGFPRRTGNGCTSKISCRNLFRAPVGTRCVNAVITSSICGNS